MLSALYFLLLGPDHTIFSISTLNTFILHAPNWEGRLVIFFIPIYFSVMVFGGCVVGWLVGTVLHRLLHHTTSQ